MPGTGGFEKFVEAHHTRLVGVLALACGDQRVAEDLAQEALLRLYTRWSLRRPDSPWAWVCTVGLNLVRSRWRRQAAHRRAIRRAGPEPVSVDDPDVASIVAIRQAVAALPERQRRAVILRFYAGLTVAEAADAMRCAEGTVKALTHQAVESLRRRLDSDEHEEVVGG